MPTLTLTLLPGTYAVCRLDPDARIPDLAALPAGPDFLSLTRTTDELSLVCPSGLAPADAVRKDDFRAFKVAGPLDFGLTGILARIASALAEAGISIFAISTYDTDYILVRSPAVGQAIQALTLAGCRVEPEGDRS